MKFDKRSFLAAAAMAALASFSMPAVAANMIGNCEVTGEKGSIPIANPAKAGQFTVVVSLPAPIWWNGDTPESIKDGMEYCFAAEIAWRAGYDKFELVNVGWDPLVTGQVTDFDLAISEISITDARKKVVDFSIPYFSSDIGVLVRADAPVDGTTIKDKTVGVQQATTGASFVADVLKHPADKTQVYPDQGDMFTALAAGQIDAAVTDTSIVLAEEVKTKGQHVVAGQYKTGESYGAIYPKGGANNATLDKIIKSIIDDGTISKLADKYLAAVWGKDPAKVPYFTP
ncbi:ABC transporter substrate-binding protein [Aestuariivirga sp. YIM B02566]|uniref:Amino acid ABC transporter substrate-binding protein n=1 Tax=Taklimakanibacter albus TaxID=2800327 RepID=A0ACC5R053_9HYPH|nr:ABC transporter substrate-binding protein [Aestuariivirga sp. YIM B02566]MBK1866051.1 amino acid ABC transporter substrate-binding protein [Aestuariivirga sp. YIM B02566]